MPKKLSKKKSTFSQKINEIDAIGRKWIGYDGLLNMETFALVAIFFMIFMPTAVSAGVTFLLALAKCYCDKKRGHVNEKHDLICAGIGIIFGRILGLAF
jgi:hypothetical protein